MYYGGVSDLSFNPCGFNLLSLNLSPHQTPLPLNPVPTSNRPPAVRGGRGEGGGGAGAALELEMGKRGRRLRSTHPPPGCARVSSTLILL